VSAKSFEHQKEENYHKERSNNPVDQHAEKDLDPDRSFPKDAVESFVLDFAKNGIHHHKQADSLGRRISQQN